MSGVGDAFNRVKKTVSDNPDKAEDMVDKASETAKKATGGTHDDKIDKGSDAATDYLRKRAGRNEDKK